MKPYLWKFYGAPFVKWKPYHRSALHLCLILQTMQSCSAIHHSKMIWIMLVKVSSSFENSYALVCLKQWYPCIPFIFWIESIISETLGFLIISSYKESYLMRSCGNGFLIYAAWCFKIYYKWRKIYVVLLGSNMLATWLLTCNLPLFFYSMCLSVLLHIWKCKLA
jgi:hypothetical protein